MSEEKTKQDMASQENPSSNPNIPYHDQVEEYGDGHIQARHGIIPVWLLAVYAIMFVWAIYYGWKYWGGLGPGLDY